MYMESNIYKSKEDTYQKAGLQRQILKLTDLLLTHGQVFGQSHSRVLWIPRIFLKKTFLPFNPLFCIKKAYYTLINNLLFVTIGTSSVLLPNIWDICKHTLRNNVRTFLEAVVRPTVLMITWDLILKPKNRHNYIVDTIFHIRVFVNY